jgi:pimeloyl-ACP methyl ester carboxylesterase
MKSTGKLCKVDRMTCAAGLTLISEMNNTVNNLERLPVIMAHFPSGSSTKNLLHYQQFLKKEEFNNFDYGKNNQAVYGQKTPPIYNLSKITVPVHLYVGKYDKLADVEDSTRLFNELTNSPNKVLII